MIVFTDGAQPFSLKPSSAAQVHTAIPYRSQSRTHFAPRPVIRPHGAILDSSRLCQKLFRAATVPPKSGSVQIEVSEEDAESRLGRCPQLCSHGTAMGQ